MVIMNVIKILYNVSHIIWYKLHNAWLHMIDVELWIPMNLMTTPNTIDENDDLVNDYIDSWYEVDSTNQMDSNKTNQYDGPYCETP